MASNFNKPVVADAYATSYANIVGNLQDLAKGLDPANCSVSNAPTNAIRWSSASSRWERYNGSTWAALSSTYAINISGNAATATTAGSATTAASCSGNAATVTNGMYTNSSSVDAAGTFHATVVNYNVSISSLPNADIGWEAKGNGTGPAVMTFHRPGVFAAYLGIDTDNQWKVGGWSMGANAYNLVHSGNLGSGLSFSGGVLSCTVTAPVSSVNGQTGAVTVKEGIKNGSSQSPSGSSVVTFTDVPNGVRKVTITINGLSTNSVTGGFCKFRMGSTTIETSGYFNADSGASSPNASVLNMPPSAAATVSGTITCTLLDASTNTWFIECSAVSVNSSTVANASPSGATLKQLSGAFNRFDITTVSGNFDAGSVSYMYE